jgi:hypothetical protein
MALQPVGPLPASTYWRRRVLIGLAVLLLLLVGLKACGGDDDATPRALATSPKPSPSPVVSAAASPSPAGPQSPAPVAACGDAALQVTVEADAASYASGAAPRFALKVVNTGTVPCRRALGPDAVEVRVFSGEDRIWSSDDCNKATGQGVLELAPGDPRQLVVQWPGKRTKPGCDVGEVAKPGTYRVSARVGDIVRQGTVFSVTG